MFVEKLKKLTEINPNKRQGLLFYFLVTTISVIWRFYKVFLIPGNLNVFEAKNVQKIIELSSNFRIIPSDTFNGIYLYLFSIVGKLAGFNISTLRLTQGVIGTCFILIFYYFVKNWFNRQTAILASILLATNFFSVLVSRNIEPKILIPITVISILLLFTTAFRTNKIYYYFIAGIVVGLSFYIDIIFLFMPIVGLMGYLYLFIKKRKAFYAFLNGLIASSITAVLIGSYSIYQFFSKPVDNFNQFNPGSIGQFYLNLGGNVQTLFYKSPIDSTFGVGIEPVLDPFVALSFLCGFVYAVFYLKRKKFMVLTTWFIISLIIISLKSIQTQTDYIILLPVIFTLSAIMLDYVLTHWVRTFPFNKPARMLMTFVFSLFLFLSIFYNFQKYFWAFGKPSNLEKNYIYKIEDIKK